MVSDDRIVLVNAAAERPRGDYVLYWMTAARRARASAALERAVGHAARFKRPLLVLEAIDVTHPWACDRFHRFVLDGMADNAAAFAARGVLHHAYVEPSARAGRGLVAALAARACVVVADDAPIPFLEHRVMAAAASVDVRMEAVDGVGIVPTRRGGKAFSTARQMRGLIQKTMPRLMDELVLDDPLARLPQTGPAELPRGVLARWPSATSIDALPIDHEVGVVPTRGGSVAAHARLRAFVDGDLPRYGEQRGAPDKEATSGLSPYLHFGHLSTAEVLRAVIERDGPPMPAAETFLGLSPSTESFLDELLTWRELAHNGARFIPAPSSYASLPGWARATLAEHAKDPRPAVYDHDTLARGVTDDDVWNTAQRQLLATGAIHNALRMLWGKKILEWSASPGDALATLFALNDRYALDGRDPNSVANICWVLGRYDRPWPPRPIFGAVRSMSSSRTAKKGAAATIARYTSAAGSTRARRSPTASSTASSSSVKQTPSR